MRRLLAFVLGVTLAACGGGGAEVVVPRVDRLKAIDDADVDLDFEIPAGTNEPALAGDRPDLLPREIAMELGDVIRVRDDDVIGYDVGPFHVGAQETMIGRASAVGSYTSRCGLHSSGEITVTDPN